MTRVLEGRLATIKKFKEFVDTNAKEVPTIHNFFKQFPWILDPRWTDLQDEVHYSVLLKSKYPESELDESDRRIDFLCLGFNDTIHIVELKRPAHHVGKKDLEQIQDYIVFIKSKFGTDPHYSYRNATGYLICGEIQRSEEIRTRIEMHEKNAIYVRTYSELVSKTEALHRSFIDKYEELEKVRSLRYNSNPN